MEPFPWRRPLFGVAFFVAWMAALELVVPVDGRHTTVPEAVRFALLCGALFAVPVGFWEGWTWRGRRAG